MRNYLRDVPVGTRLIDLNGYTFTICGYDCVLDRVRVRYDRWPGVDVWDSGRTLTSFLVYADSSQTSKL